METLFGLAVLVLIILGLRYRKKQKREWLKEERFDESGAWIDKRAGERGTFGSLDEEREAERQRQSRTGKIEALAWLLQNWVFEHYPGFHTLDDKHIREYLAFNKTQATTFIGVIGSLLQDQMPDAPARLPEENTLNLTLKKQILNFSYEEFPKLLDHELEAIKRLDLIAGDMTNALFERIEMLKQKS